MANKPPTEISECEDWLNKELEKTKASIIAKPVLLVGLYQGEEQRRIEYKGRELLEMLQNAEDQITAEYQDPKVRIDLSPGKLVVANHGVAFSEEGIESLMTANVSSKTLRADTIGNKGLGFRSILNWAHKIRVISGGFQVEFAREHAEDFLKGIYQQHPEIREKVCSKSAEEFPIATLSIPNWIAIDPKQYQAFDTYIEIDFQGEEVYKSVERQIEEIDESTVIFLPRLNHIHIKTDKFEKEIEKKPLHDGRCKVILSDSRIGKNKEREWSLFENDSTANTLPKNLQNGEFKVRNKYSLQIAFQDDLSDNKFVLFNYFKTATPFPFPMLVHGTFELEGNRNHLPPSPVNAFLLGQLAELMLEAAKKFTEKEVSWKAFQMLAPLRSFAPPLDDGEWDFKQILRQKLDEFPILPTISGKYISINQEPQCYSFDFDAVLPFETFKHFPNVLKHTEEPSILSFLQNIREEKGLSLKIPASEMVSGLNALTEHPDFDLNFRSEWIYLISENQTGLVGGNEKVWPNLLIDENQDVIQIGDDAILPASDNLNFKLPPGFHIKFVDPDLVKKLQQRFGGMGLRTLKEKLAGFKVQEYAFDVVIRKLISETNGRIKILPEQEETYLSILHSGQRGIFEMLRKAEKLEPYPSNISAPRVPNRSGKILSADQLYFGKEYDEGFLAEQLLIHVDRELFVCASNWFPAAYKKEEGDSTEEEDSRFRLEEYLKWIGVAVLPRVKPVEISANSYKQNAYIKKGLFRLQYPLTTPGYKDVFEKPETFQKAWGFKAKVLGFEYQDEIIEKAPFEALLAWFSQEKRIRHNLVNNTEPETSSFHFELPSKQYSRYLNPEDLPSHFLYTLKQKNFIPIGGNRKVLPSQCLIASDSLAPLVSVPSINKEAEIFSKIKIEEEFFNQLFKTLGVKEDFRSLAPSDIYDLLGRHHIEFSEEKGKARTLYRLIIESTVGKKMLDLESRNAYLQDGFILAKENGTEEWFPVQEVTYVDNPNFCKDLTKKFKLAALPKRRGNDRMKDLFGVSPLAHVQFSVNVTQEDAELNNLLTVDFEALKPLLFIYRQQKALKLEQKISELSALKKLKVKTCFDMEVHYQLEANSEKERLSPKKYEYIQDSETGIIYIKVSRGVREFSELKQDQRFRETLSDIICGTLKVSEHQKDFMILFGEKRINRSALLEREFDDFAQLERQVMHEFKGMMTAEERFWTGILKMIGREVKVSEEVDTNKKIFDLVKKNQDDIQWDDFFSWSRKIDYHKLSDPGNFSSLKALFKALGKDLQDFNQLGERAINMESILLHQLKHNIHDDFSNRYQIWLFNHLSAADRKHFLSRYRKLAGYQKFSVENSLYFDLKASHKRVLAKEFPGLPYQEVAETANQDLEVIYATNLKELEKKMQSLSGFSNQVFDGIKYNDQDKSLIFFNQTKDIEVRLAKAFQESENEPRKREITMGGETVVVNEENVDDLISRIADQMDQGKFHSHDLDPEKTTPRTGGGNGGPWKNNSNRNKKLSNEEIGYLGEKYAYHYLQRFYDNVKWVSEYAIKDGQSTGEDGLGYDFECKKGDETRFIEVKSSMGGQFSFKISQNEILVGHRKKSHYDILLVRNMAEEVVDFYTLKNVFEYEGSEENFESNEKFMVTNDICTIVFKPKNIM